jgi:23S rRNA maturation mini-RNase III
MAYYYLVVGLLYKLEFIDKVQYDKLNKLAIKGVIPDQPEQILTIIENVLKEDEASFAKRVRSFESRLKSVETGISTKLDSLLKGLEAKKKASPKIVVDIKK